MDVIGLEFPVAENEFVTAVHEKTNLVQEIPRHYLTVYPDFRELNEAEKAQRQRGREKKMFGDFITPAPVPKAVKPVEVDKEGSK